MHRHHLVSPFNHSVSIILVAIITRIYGRLWWTIYIHLYRKPILYQRKKTPLKFIANRNRYEKGIWIYERNNNNNLTTRQFTSQFHFTFLYVAYAYDTRWRWLTNKAHKVIILIRHKVNHISWCDPYTNSGAPPWSPMSVLCINKLYG